MARKVIHQLVDDLDGTVLEPGSGETVHFALDGVQFEIDLTAANAAELRAALEPYRAVARKATRGSRGSGRPARDPRIAEIRAWAHEEGLTVSSRGRIPEPIVEAYDAAH